MADIRTDKEMRSLRLLCEIRESRRAARLAWSHQRDRIAVLVKGTDGNTRSQTISLWSGVTGRHLHDVHLTSRADFVDVAWSPDGNLLATCDERNGLALRSTETWKVVCEASLNHGPEGIESHSLSSGSWYNPEPDPAADCVELRWRPNNSSLLCAMQDRSLRLWDWRAQTIHILAAGVSLGSVSWAPDARALAYVGATGAIVISELDKAAVRTIEPGSGIATRTAWSPDGQLLAAACGREIHVWQAASGALVATLTGASTLFFDVGFSSDGAYLGAVSPRGSGWVWLRDTWRLSASRRGEDGTKQTSMAFAAQRPLWAILQSTPEEQVLRVWDLDPGTSYTNAKIVIVGEQGVGKTGLARVLSGQQFQPTEATHGMELHHLQRVEAELPNGIRETREVLLWDMAGQPGYRLIHQLYLHQAAVAFIVIDPESDRALDSLDDWERALRVAERLRNGRPIQRILVAARIDVGRGKMGRTRLAAEAEHRGFAAYVETSAKTGEGMQALSSMLERSLGEVWPYLPRVQSLDLCADVQSFLIQERRAGRVLSLRDDLLRCYCYARQHQQDDSQLAAAFDAALELLATQGLVRPLCMGRSVLLRPEILDAYAAALVNSARAHPAGLGAVPTDDLSTGLFLPAEIRPRDHEEERLLLIATEEEILRYELGVYDYTETGRYLIFPSEITRQPARAPALEHATVVFSFDGPLLSIYATLIVRLANSGYFTIDALWRDGARFRARSETGLYGTLLRRQNESRGELALFFDEHAMPSAKGYFEQYIRLHLERRAGEGTLCRRRVVICLSCNTPPGEKLIEYWLRQRRQEVPCPACNTILSLRDDPEQVLVPTTIATMDRAADDARDRAVAAKTIEGKRAINDYDVFLCHRSADKQQIKRVGRQLLENGILPWLDEWDLRPGCSWQRELERQISKIKAAAVFVGAQSLGPWQEMEHDAFLREFVRRACPVIPVILADCECEPDLPKFLEGLTWVDFRKSTPDPLRRLIWGITGKREGLYE